MALAMLAKPRNLLSPELPVFREIMSLKVAFIFLNQFLSRYPIVLNSSVNYNYEGMASRWRG